MARKMASVSAATQYSSGACSSVSIAWIAMWLYMTQAQQAMSSFSRLRLSS